MSCASILAAVLSDQGKYKEADELFKQTLAHQKQLLRPEHRDTLVTMWNRSVSYPSQWRLVEGEALARDMSDIAARTLDPDDSLNILSNPLLVHEFDKAGVFLLREAHRSMAEALL